MNARDIELDLRVGGLGDNWMRLVGFYVTAGLRPDYNFRLVLPGKLMAVAKHAFGDRLQILAEPSSPRVISYAVRGLRDLLGPALRGAKFASPYGRVVIHDWARWRFKDRLNSMALTACDMAGLVYSPPWKSLQYYQGYSEVVTIPALRRIGYGDFVKQLAGDYDHIAQRLQGVPVSPDFVSPDNLSDKVVVFPTGTGYQFIPLEWAKEHLPNAVYAFFHRDPDWEIWKSAGMQTVAFYTEPGDMLALARASKLTMSTDSFPSHFLQYCAPRLAVMLTELPRHRVVSPVFNGDVIESRPACYPCPHLERRGFPVCKAGHSACLNWGNSEYIKDIMALL